MSKINLITRENADSLGFDFEEIADMALEFECVYSEHRKGDSFFVEYVVEINEETFPEFDPKFHGFWKTNTFVHSSDHGYYRDDITTLQRVISKVKMIEVQNWEPVNN
jgi:hypothetical protein